jgi:hypothetical protein
VTLGKDSRLRTKFKAAYNYTIPAICWYHNQWCMASLSVTNGEHEMAGKNGWPTTAGHNESF